MRSIPQRVAPSSLTTLRATGATYEMVRSDPSIRRVLWQQQGRRCAYCERILRDPDRDDHRTRIEHFHPQSSPKWNNQCRVGSGAVNTAKAPTTWSNLLLCCDGNELAGKDFTCDKSKGNTDICSDFRNPKIWHRDRLVHIGRSGQAKPVEGLPADAATIIDVVLNLNSEELVAARKRVLDARRKSIVAQSERHHGLSASLRSQIADILRRDATTLEYGSTLLSLADEVVGPS